MYFFRFHRLVALFQWSKYKNSIFDHFPAIKMAPPGGDIKFVFGRSNSKFPTLSLSKKKLQNFSVTLKKSDHRSLDPSKNDVNMCFISQKRISCKKIFPKSFFILKFKHFFFWFYQIFFRQQDFFYFINKKIFNHILIVDQGGGRESRAQKFFVVTCHRFRSPNTRRAQVKAHLGDGFKPPSW